MSGYVIIQVFTRVLTLPIYVTLFKYLFRAHFGAHFSDKTNILCHYFVLSCCTHPLCSKILIIRHILANLLCIHHRWELKLFFFTFSFWILLCPTCAFRHDPLFLAISTYFTLPNPSFCTCHLPATYLATLSHSKISVVVMYLTQKNA